MKKMFLVLLLLLVSNYALADQSAQSNAVLNDTLDLVKSNVGAWADSITKGAMSLFGYLTAIELAVLAIILLLKGAELQETVAELIKKIFWFGFILALIQHGTEWFDSIVASFSQLGAGLAMGQGVVVGDQLGPSAIIDTSLTAGDKIITAAGKLPWDAIGAILGFYISAALVVIAGFVSAAFAFIAIVESIIVMAVVGLIAALGTTRFTSDFVGKTFSYAMSISIKLFFIYAVSGLSVSMINNATAKILNDDNITMLAGLSVAGLAILAAILVMQIPAVASSALSGAPAMNAGSVVGNAAALGTVGGAAGVLGAGVAKGGADALSKSLAQTAGIAGGSSASAISNKASDLLGSSSRNAASTMLNGAGATSAAATLGGSLRSASATAQDTSSSQAKKPRGKSGMRKFAGGATNAAKNLSQQEFSARSHIPGVNVRLDV